MHKITAQKNAEYLEYESKDWTAFGSGVNTNMDILCWTNYLY